MDAHQIHVKLFLAGGAPLTSADVTPVFHGWIQRQALPGELLIDIADYSHVHNGPLALLLAHESHYALDGGGGRLGLLYARKREAQPVAPAQRLVATLRRLFSAAQLLVGDPGLASRVKFNTGELWVRVLDRLRAPNTAATWTALAPEVTQVAQALYGHQAQVEREGGEREPFSLRIRAGTAPSLDELLARVNEAAA